MTTTLWITLIAACLAFIASMITLLLTLSSQKKTRYINTITSSRIKWIGDIRDSISEFISLLPEDTKKQEEQQFEKQNLLEKLSKIKSKIILLLNSNKQIDRNIILSIEEIYMQVRYYHALVDCIVVFDNGEIDYGHLMHSVFNSVLTREDFKIITSCYYDYQKIKKFDAMFNRTLSAKEIDDLLDSICDYMIHSVNTPSMIKQKIRSSII